MKIKKINKILKCILFFNFEKQYVLIIYYNYVKIEIKSFTEENMPSLSYTEVLGYKTKDQKFIQVTTANKQTLRDGKTVLFTLVNNKYQPVFKFWRTENGNVFSAFILGDCPDYTVVYGFKDHNKEFILVSNPAEKILKDGKKVLFTVANGNYQSVYEFWKFKNGKVFSPAVFNKSR
jgi:hypothetical protein